jgi:hypothetical protein
MRPAIKGYFKIAFAFRDFLMFGHMMKIVYDG